MIGGRGVFNQTNIENRKEYSLKEWHHLCNQNEHRPPKINGNEGKISHQFYFSVY